MKKINKFTALTLLLFLFLSQPTVLAQEKPTDYTIENLKVEVKMDKDSSDEDLEAYIAKFKIHNVNLKFSKLKRNANDEITSISISLESDTGLNSKSSFKSNDKPIIPQNIFIQINNDKVTNLGITPDIDKSRFKKQ